MIKYGRVLTRKRGNYIDDIYDHPLLGGSVPVVVTLHPDQTPDDRSLDHWGWIPPASDFEAVTYIQPSYQKLLCCFASKKRFLQGKAVRLIISRP